MANPSDRTPADAETEWLSLLGKQFPITTTPGYWSTVADNAETWARELAGGSFWTAASARFNQWRTEYHGKKGADLFLSANLPSFVAKSEKSIKEKLYRRYLKDRDSLETCISNDLPDIGDLVRARVVCNYIDGVEFFANKLVDLGHELKTSPIRQRQGKIEGYFAQHIEVKQEVIWRFFAQSSLTAISCEVQVASMMATKMWEVSHSLYEGTRRSPSEAEKWQWEPSDPQFMSNQLGHMIHLVDGLLVQLRDSTKVKK